MRSWTTLMLTQTFKREFFNGYNFLTSSHLHSIFDWNVKQLFLYLSAEYATKNNVSIILKVVKGKL